MDKIITFTLHQVLNISFILKLARDNNNSYKFKLIIANLEHDF